MSYKDVLK